MTQKYNGWTNYATWRIALEVFDGIDLSYFEIDDIYDLSQDLKAYAEDHIFMDVPNSLARDYAYAFLQEVNFYEIASNLVQDYVTEKEVA
jgi:hypothetical protein